MKRTAVFMTVLFLSAAGRAELTSLNMGMDYRLRGISIKNNDLNNATNDTVGYYSHGLRFYMTTWLNEDVEASMRLHSINVWGLEGEKKAPATRYPSTAGTPWLEEAYIHLPHFAWKKVNLIIGRQPIVVGDGTLVSDDELGFNAIRAQADLPFKLDLDVFTAKVAESMAGHDDSDLNGVVLGTDQSYKRWELAMIREQNSGISAYRLASSTYTASRVFRQFYDLRLFGSLQDAYYKMEYTLQSGDANLDNYGSVKLKGNAQKLELGAQSDTLKFGRFGVHAVYTSGSGDDAGTPKVDEAFRPTFAKRWDGLQRVGYGTHYAATLSDAYDKDSAFNADTSMNPGLPPGFSGIKTLGLGVFSTQKVTWTGSVDYYWYTARTKPTGKNDLGTELDGQLIYRYTGFVSFKFGMAYFFPGQVYGNLAAKATRYTAETHIHF